MFLTEFVIKLFNDSELKLYIIKENTEIYRGDTDQWYNKKNINIDYEYFTMDFKTANIYGLVKKYKINHDILLLALDNINNLKVIYEIAPTNVKHAISECFGYTIDNERIIRNSNSKLDKLILSFLCSLNFDGYGANEITLGWDKNFHHEIAICNPNDKIKVIEKIEYDEDERLKHELTNVSLNLKSKRKNAPSLIRVYDEKEILPKKLLFDD